MLGNLARSPSSGVTRGDEVLDDVSPGKLADWARHQTPPFSVPASILDAVKNNVDTRQDLSHLPGTDFYAVNGTEGTLYCYGSGVYFTVRDGKASAATPPSTWADPDCLSLRSFGTVDHTPVAFVENNISPNGDYILVATPWRGNGFGRSCTATFHFAQRLVTPDESDNSYIQPDDCEGGDKSYCARLKTATWALVRQLQNHAGSLAAWREAEIRRLTHAQSRQFRILTTAFTNESRREFGKSWKPATTSDGATKYAPLLLPLVEGGEVYLAKAGHALMRDISMPDWQIAIRGISGHEPDSEDVATFSVGVQTGGLTGVTLK